jgi:glutathione S-transferase
MSVPVLYGPGYCSYTRTVRLALEEKGVAYRLEEVDFLHGGMPPEQLARHPFGKVPALEHDGFRLYETCAITRYIDEIFPGPALQPDDACQRARMTQIIGIIDSYGYPAIMGKLVIPRLILPILGGSPNESEIKAGLPAVRTSIAALEALLGSNRYLAGDRLSLADLHLEPIFAYFSITPECGPVLDKAPRLRRWWAAMSTRESMKETEPQLA